jgi:arylformamidase
MPSHTLSDGWIDVSVPLGASLPTWPGDPRLEIRHFGSYERGDQFQATALSLSAHTGTHMDSMRHFIRGGRTMSDWVPGDTVGAVRIVQLETPGPISIAALEQCELRAGERILFRTVNSSTRWYAEPFNEGFVCFTAESAEYLASRQIRTVGVDYLSVGNTSNGVAVHNHILGAGIWIIEGLYLGDVAPGAYEMICLPVKLAEADGVPCRVLVRPLSG